MSFADVALAATEHAERGFAISQFTAYQMGANADKYRAGRHRLRSTCVTTGAPGR